MIHLTSDLSELLQTDIANLFYLVRVKDYYCTSNFVDILHDGHVYQADGALVKVSAPQLGSVVDSATYRAEFADGEFIFAEHAETGLFGARFTVSVSADKSDGSILTPFTIFDGTINKAGYAVRTDLIGDSLFVVEGGSPVNNVDLKRPFRTSKEYLHQIDVTDSAFNSVYQSSGQLILKWGK